MADFIINSRESRHAAVEAVKNITAEPLMMVTIAPYVKKRSKSQNSMQWVALLGDFSMQVIIDGKQFAANVWHEHLKEKCLPGLPEEGITLKGYVKWMEMPCGKLKLVGSTTKLTTKGFSDYIERCYAYGVTEFDIRFSANPGDR